MSIVEILLAAIVGLLVVMTVVIAYGFRRTTNAPKTISATLTANFNDEIKRLTDAVRHHIDINAVTELVRQLDANPDALELIKSYPETVRAAAWLHYINTLGSDLQTAQRELSMKHDMRSQYGSAYNGSVNDAQKIVDSIRSKLDEAIKASGKSGLRTV